MTTLDIASTSLDSVSKVVKALGAEITERHTTPGAVGYTTITVEPALQIKQPGSDRDGVEQTLAVLRRAGWHLDYVNNGEENVKVTTADEALDAIFAVDEAYLFVREGTVHGGQSAWIRFVLGNEPEEVICDHTINLSAALDPMTNVWYWG